MLKAGEIVERYRVEGELGRGGMATVYRVRHVTLGTVHALKLLHITHPVIRQRMLTEGQAQARLRHPNIVAVTDVLDVAGQPALLMEFVGGGDLHLRLARGALALDAALELFRGIVAGVAFAHAQGVVHRDLKPANVMLAARDPARGIQGDADLVPKVTDFGLAKLMDQDGPARTRSAAAMGTPQYMPPEQIRDAKSVDLRADVYALGAMLYELACGRRAYEGTDLVTLIQKVAAGHYEPPERVRPDLPAPVATAIRGALATDRERRIPDCETLLAVLDGKRPWSATPVVAPPDAAAATMDFDSEVFDSVLGAGEGAASHRGGAGGPTPVRSGEPSLVPSASGALALPDPSQPQAGGSDTFDPWMTAAGQASDAERRAQAVEPAVDPAPPPPARPPPPEGPALPPSDTSLTAPASVRTMPEPVETLVSTGTTRVVQALVVDGRGQGHVLEVVVTLEPGERGVWAPDGVSRETQVAAQLAIAVALGVEADRTSAKWAVRGAGVELHGTSIGLAVAVAARAARNQVPVPAGWAFTGGVDLDGRVAGVDGVPAKLRAALAAGVQHVAVPVAELEAPDGLDVVAVRSFEALAARLVPGGAQLHARRRVALRSLALLAPVLLALFDVFAPREVALQYPLLRATRGELAVENVAILGVDVPEPKALRVHHAETVAALVDAGARAIFFDIAMSDPGEPDEELAAAVRAAEAGGVTVVLPVRFFSSGVRPPGTPALAEAGHLGLVELRKDRGTGAVRMAEVRRRDEAERVYWHGAVHAAAAYLGGAEPRIDGSTLVIGPTKASTWAEMVAIHPFGDVPVVDYFERERFEELSGKVVVIGAFGGTRDVFESPDGPRYGVELHAGLVETLVRQQALRLMSPLWAALAALIAGAGAVGLGLVLPPGRRWVALVVPVGVLAVGVVAAASGTLVTLGPSLVAAVVALWVLRAAR